MFPSSSNQSFKSRLFLGGAVLTGFGSLLAMLGLAMGSVAVIEAGRRWQRRTEMSPAELAKHVIGTAQIATTAGAQAWRAPMPDQGRRVAPSDGRVQPVP